MLSTIGYTVPAWFSLLLGHQHCAGVGDLVSYPNDAYAIQRSQTCLVSAQSRPWDGMTTLRRSFTESVVHPSRVIFQRQRSATPGKADIVEGAAHRYCPHGFKC